MLHVICGTPGNMVGWQSMGDIVLLRKGNCHCHEVSEIRNMYRCLILSGWQDSRGSGLSGHQNLLDAPTGKQSSCIQSLPSSWEGGQKYPKGITREAHSAVGKPFLSLQSSVPLKVLWMGRRTQVGNGDEARIGGRSEKQYCLSGKSTTILPPGSWGDGFR